MDKEGTASVLQGTGSQRGRVFGIPGIFVTATHKLSQVCVCVCTCTANFQHDACQIEYAHMHTQANKHTFKPGHY